jgi:hypothetical protein
MGHFYYLDEAGAACPLYEVPYADPSKGMRSATLKDAKKLDGVPSPNTIMQVEAKPGLVRWSDNLLIDACQKILERTPAERAADPHTDWRKLIADLHKEMKEAAANEGTAIHKAIEDALVGSLPTRSSPYDEIVDAALEWLEETDIEVTGVEQYFVNHDLGLGGMIDVVGLVDGEYIPHPYNIQCSRETIVDWKSTTTEGKSDSQVTRYWKEKAALMSAYAMGYFGALDVDCWNIYLSRDEPGRIIPHNFTKEKIEFGWKKFQHCYELWVMDKGFDPRENGRKS